MENKNYKRRSLRSSIPYFPYFIPHCNEYNAYLHNLAHIYDKRSRPSLCPSYKGKIFSGQKSRGANFETGSIFKRAKMLIPLFVPLLFNATRRAYELAYAMTCRCYNGGKGKTTMNALKYKGGDWLVTVLTFTFIAGVIVLNIKFGEYNAKFIFNSAV